MRLHHFAWVGRDLARMRETFEREGAVVVSPPVADAIQRVTVQFLRDPAAGDRCLWELVAPLGPAAESPLASRLARGGGFDHVCYELEQSDGTLEEWVSSEVDRGGRVVCEPVRAAAFDRRIAFVFRRSQRLIECVEPRRHGQVL
jgi:glyoxalase/bleomycin resistance protein/dioxygenase superfamily protein